MFPLPHIPVLSGTVEAKLSRIIQKLAASYIRVKTYINIKITIHIMKASKTIYRQSVCASQSVTS
jgi:hypothetical protein